jgi:hypothetical protein
MGVKQELPASESIEQGVAELSAAEGTEFILANHGYEVSSWRPGPPRSGPPTQVHILFPLAPGMKAVMRLKSARALDELVGVLLEYRKEVWGAR